jgi:hypothetical protein
MRLRFLGFLWGGVVVVALAGLEYFVARPGDSGAPPCDWPAQTAITRDFNGPTVVVFVDPKCPCTQATMANLERCLARCPRFPTTRIVVLSENVGLFEGSLDDSARRLAARPEVALIWSGDGSETRRFGVKTSGEVLVYALDGRLVFDGGITPARGHQGDSPGCDAIRKLSAGEPIEYHSATVFGCSVN